MIEEKTQNIRNNLWIFRVRRKMSRPDFVRGIMRVSDYREIEYGHYVLDDAVLAKFIEKYKFTYEDLIAPPNYDALLDHPTRKLIEYHHVVLRQQQRKHLRLFLRGFMPKTY